MYLCQIRLLLKTTLAIAVTLVAAPVQAVILADINETFWQSLKLTFIVPKVS